METTEIKETLDEFGRAWEEFKAVNDRKGTEDKEQLQRINDQLDQLELRLNRPVTGGEKTGPELKELVNTWARGVAIALNPGANMPSEAQQKAIDQVAAEHKALNVTDDTSTGYLAPSEFVAEIIKGVTETSPARQIARVRTTSQKSIQIPKRTGQFAAQRVVEQGPRNETEGLSYGMEEINAPEMFALIDISNQSLEDTAFDMEMELREEATEQFALLEGQEFVTGDGVGEMEGILNTTAIGTTNTGNATNVTADGLIDLKYAIKSAYARNASFIMNRKTLGSVRKLKDGNGQYLWQPGLALGRPNSIDGDPYVEFPDMPDEAAGAKPVGYGDWRHAYSMVDRVAMSMLRDPYTQATSGNVRFIFRRRGGGQIVLGEAVRLNECAA